MPAAPYDNRCEYGLVPMPYRDPEFAKELPTKPVGQPGPFARGLG